jgi:beta-lactam-binding protein with PASTA domain
VLDCAVWSLTRGPFQGRVLIEEEEHTVSFGKRALSALGKLGIIVAIAVAFLFGLAGTIYLSLRTSEVKVPDIVGKDFLAAETALSDAGLNVRKRATRPTADKPNVVLAQLPNAGEVVKVGQTVAVDVSRAPKEGEAVLSGQPEAKPEEDKQNDNKNANDATTAKNQNGNQNNSNNQNQNKKPKNTNKNTNNSNNANRNANNRNATNSNNTNNRNANANRNTNGNRNANSPNTNRRAPSPTTTPSNPGGNTRTPQ